MREASEKSALEYRRRNDDSPRSRMLARAALAPMLVIALFTGYVGALATALGIVFLLGAFPELQMPRVEKIALLAIGPPLAVGGYALARVYRWLVRKYALRRPPTNIDAASDPAR